ncbi:MAG: hypothetical protein JWO48_2683 [Bryobacterales bacterium]|nr:hypothetical protein [Bryobacterales bacterium]
MKQCPFRLPRAALLFFAIPVATSLSLFGQAVTGTIAGNVADPSGSVLSNAAVRAIQTLRARRHQPWREQNARVDFTLEVGSFTQELRVAADAPLVDKREVQVGSTVDRDRVELCR